jgi:hypothetical protein
MRSCLPLFLAIGVGFFALAERALSEITLSSSSGIYTQDFDSLVNTGTSSSVPTGWGFLETGTNANSTYASGTGSENGGNTYSFGALASSDRAFGTLLSGSLTSTIGASFTVSNTEFLNSVTISYTGEQWRLGATGRNDRLNFQFSTDATALNNGTWIGFSGLDFIAPISTGPTGALNGNAAANRVAIGDTIVFAAPLAASSNFWIRWVDFNATGADDGLGIDDFSISGSFSAVPEPGSIALLGITGIGVFIGRKWKKHSRK